MSTPEPRGTIRTASRTSAGASANSRSIASRSCWKCDQPGERVVGDLLPTAAGGKQVWPFELLHLGDEPFGLVVLRVGALDARRHQVVLAVRDEQERSGGESMPSTTSSRCSMAGTVRFSMGVGVERLHLHLEARRDDGRGPGSPSLRSRRSNPSNSAASPRSRGRGRWCLAASSRCSRREQRGQTPWMPTSWLDQLVIARRNTTTSSRSTRRRIGGRAARICWR